MMYLNHRHEATDKRVDIRIGFDDDAENEDRTVVAFLCEPKKAQIISYLGSLYIAVKRSSYCYIVYLAFFY